MSERGSERDKGVKPVQNAAEKADRIARHLKDVYDEAVREPVPEELLKALRKLREGD